jgi:hypothetical protein
MRSNQSVRAAVAVLLFAGAISFAHAADTPLVDVKAGRPAFFAFEVEPGYFRAVLSPVDSGDKKETRHLRILLEPPQDPAWITNHWTPTSALCLRPADLASKESWCVNVSLDPDGSYGTARLNSDRGEQMFRKRTSKQFPLHEPLDLEVVRTGRNVIAKVGGETIDEGEIPFEPAFWSTGASTGVARIETIEEVEKPLGPGEWPETVDAAVADAIEQLSTKSKDVLRETPKDSLSYFYLGWGTGLRDRQGLSRGNDALRDAVCAHCNEQEATMALMEAVWRALKETPAQ